MKGCSSGLLISPMRQENLGCLDAERPPAWPGDLESHALGIGLPMSRRLTSDVGGTCEGNSRAAWPRFALERPYPIGVPGSAVHFAAPARCRNRKSSDRAGSGAHVFASKVDATFGHPRLAAIYDPLGDCSDLDAYLAMSPACGSCWASVAVRTCSRCCSPSAGSRSLASIPARASVDVARGKPDAGRVCWLDYRRRRGLQLLWVPGCLASDAWVGVLMRSVGYRPTEGGRACGSPGPDLGSRCQW